MAMKPRNGQSPHGIIPDDWESTTLGQFIALRRGHDLTERARRPGVIPVMGSAGLNGYHDKALVCGPGVVLGRSGASFGRAHYCSVDYWPHNTALYVTDFFGNDPLFVYYFLLAIDFSRHNSGGAQQSLNRNFISPLPLSVPRPAEQRMIAQALSDADALIESLEQLLAKKRAIKQGAMQELLTGKRRLPGFTGAWRQKRFGEVARQRTERVSPVPLELADFCVELEHVVPCTGLLSGHGTARTSSSLKAIFRFGDVLFGRLRAYLRKYWLANRSGVCSTEFWVLCPLSSDVTADFIFHLVQTDPFVEAASTTYGTHMPRSDWNVIRNVEVLIPELREQEAISDVLTQMGADILSLEGQLAKARLLKLAMSQQLLTGKIRLI